MKRNLNVTQKKVAEMLATKDVHGKSNRVIAQECNITERRIYDYQNDPVFIKYMNDIAEKRQKAFLSNAYVELRNIILNSHNDSAKLKGLELFFKNQGKLKDVSEQHVEVTTGSDDIKARIEALRNNK